MYQCRVCKSQYARSDHLVRHVRVHTNDQRPFTCGICSKGFGRQDLLRRHMLTHDEAGAEKDGFDAQTKRNSQRVNQACRLCAAKKLKCTDEKPCKRCKDKKLPCDFGQNPDSPVYEEPDEANSEILPTEVPSTVHAPSPPQLQDLENCLQPEIYFQDSSDLRVVPSIPPALESDVAIAHDVTMEDIWSSTLHVPSFNDFLQLEADSVPEDIDFSFLDAGDMPSLDMRFPDVFQVGDTSLCTPTSPLAAGAEAFRKSKVLSGWRPETDGVEVEEDRNLILTPNVKPSGLPSSTVRAHTLPNELSLAARDRILALILRKASTKLADSIIGSFPSIGVLNNLVHLAYIHMKEHMALQFIHLPSFDPDAQRPELLGAIIAYGSICSPSLQVRKFGYAVQEAVRTAIIHMVEEHHAPLRDVAICQAFYIQSYLAFYSGISRKIEMAECYSGLGVTLLRRADMLSRRDYSSLEHILDLHDLTLEQKWLRWTEQESRKRLVYFAVILDAHVSASRKTAVSIPYAELETPLPALEKLWIAGTAGTWSDLLPQAPTIRSNHLPLLCQLLRQPGLITTHDSLADTTTAALIFLAGFWSLVAEYQQASLALVLSQSWNDDVFSSKHIELTSIMDQFRAEVIDINVQCPELMILQEFTSLHLNVSFYVLTNYAGTGTKHEAQLALPYVQGWYGSSKARAAIWNAAQIFRAAKQLPPRSLADIYAIALYHAALVLWVWALLRRSYGAGAATGEHEVALDREESSVVWRFQRASRGLPGVTSLSGTFLPLHNPTVAPELANDIIVANWQLEHLPTTTEEVSQLMNEFVKISRQMFRDWSI